LKRIVPTPFPTDPEVRDAAILGAAVRSARTASGLSIQDAALAIGVAKQTLSNLEAGKPSVGLGLSLRIARELGVTLLAVPAATGEVARRRISDQMPRNPAIADRREQRKRRAP